MLRGWKGSREVEILDIFTLVAYSFSKIASISTVMCEFEM